MNEAKTDFVEIFQTLRASLQPYATMGFDNRENSETNYDLWSNKNVEIEGEKRNEVFFASVTIHENSVGLHFEPIIADSSLKNVLDIGLLDLLEIDAYFHILKLDDALLSKIEFALAEGFRLYKEKGWV